MEVLKLVGRTVWERRREGGERERREEGVVVEGGRKGGREKGREGRSGRGARIEEGTQLVVCLSYLHGDHPTRSPPELDHIQAVGENDVRLSLQQTLRLLSCYFGNSAEDVCTVCGCPLQTVAVIDLSVTCLLVHIELQTGHMTHEYHY